MRSSNLRLASIALLALAVSRESLVGVAQAPITPRIAVAPQYDSIHVYVAPENVDAFVTAFLGTFGGQSSKQAVVTVTPTPSSTPAVNTYNPGKSWTPVN